jgi:hypothetical protein
MIKQLPAVLASHLDFQRKVTKKFDYLCHMIVILAEHLSLTMRVKQEFASQELKSLEI